MKGSKDVLLKKADEINEGTYIIEYLHTIFKVKILRTVRYLLAIFE